MCKYSCVVVWFNLPIPFTICKERSSFSYRTPSEVAYKERGVVQNGNRLLPLKKTTFKKLHSCWRTTRNCVKHYESK